MFYFTNTLLIGAFLDVLMLTIACSEACLAVGPGMGVENTYICSNVQTCSILNIGGGSVAVKSLISLCHMEGKPPFGQERTCSIENLAPHPHVEGAEKGC